MPLVLTNGETKIGAYKFKDRKKVALCIEKGNTVEVYGYFNNRNAAKEFMEQLGKIVNADFPDKKEKKDGADND